MKPRVLVTRHVYPPAIAILQEHCVVDYRDTYDVMDEAALQRRLQHADGVLCQLTDPLTADVLQAAPKLRVVSQIAVGHDNIDVSFAKQRGIVVTHTPGVLTEATADLTWALLLATARRVPAAEQFLRRGEWQRWAVDLWCGADVHGRTLGLVGFGRIGQAVARRAAGFGMRVLYSSTREPEDQAAAALGIRVPLDTLLQQSDFVSLHVPLRPATERLIGAEQLCRMKRSAFLINTSRGQVVHEAALVAALEEGLLAGAGLDVFEQEPQIHPGLLALPQVVLLPHIGSAVTSVRSLMCSLAASDCCAVLLGQAPKHPVQPTGSISPAEGG